MLGPLLVAASITGALVPPLARREALVHLVAGSSAASLLSALPAAATDAAISPKRKNLPPAELAKLVRADIEQKQFLVSGQLTREIYDESATFTDAIDTCALASSHLERSKARNAVSLSTLSLRLTRLPAVARVADTLDKWIKGTGALFVAEQSHVDIVGEVESNDREVRFRFTETLAFNLPLIKPKVPLTGTLVLTRDADSGLITKYLEIWDTGVWETLSKAKL